MAHITQEQRYTISCMLKRGHKQIEIVKTIGKDKSVISRELKRNSDNRNGVYRAELANRKQFGDLEADYYIYVFRRFASAQS